MGSRWRSEAERLEEEVRIAEWQAAEGERERAARERLAELTALEAGPAAESFQKAPPRRPGRPSWTSEGFLAKWHKAREACGSDADDLTLATSSEGFEFVDGRQLQALIRRFGRPSE